MMRGRGATAAVALTTLLHGRCDAIAGRFFTLATSDVAPAGENGWPVESRRQPGADGVG